MRQHPIRVEKLGTFRLDMNKRLNLETTAAMPPDPGGRRPADRRAPMKGFPDLTVPG